MKNMYLCIAALTIGVGSFAQSNGPVQEANWTVEAKQIIRPIPQSQVYRPDRGGAIWSDDFSGGVTWTTTNTGTPSADWVIGTNPPSGSFSSGMGAIASTTAGNNFAMFDSDALGSGTSAQDAIIYYGPIDLSSEPAVSVVFESYYRRYEGVCYVITSTDGVSWDQHEVHGNVALNAATANPEVVSVNVTGSIAGSSTAYIGFQYIGGWDYAWMVDDVSLIVPPPNELQLLSRSWGSQDSVPYTRIPGDQSANINTYFGGSFSNIGSNDQPGSFLDVTVTDNGGLGSVVYSGQSTPGTVNVGQVVNTFASPTYNFGTTPGDYEIEWKANYPNYTSDDDSLNNVRTQVISITDNEYARDNQNNAFSGGGLFNGGDAFVITNEYDMYTTRSLTNIRCALNTNTADGISLYGVVYQVDTSTGDFILVYDGGGTATGEFEVQPWMISSSSALTWVNVPIDGGSFTMAAGNIYLVGIGHYGGPEEAYILNGGITAPEQTVFIYDVPTSTWFYMTSTPTIRAVFDPEQTLGVEENNGSITLGQNVPNPMNGYSTINYSIDNSTDVTFEITDISGKMIERMDLGTQVAGEHIIRLNADNYSNGIYFYTLNAGKERLTKRMVVTR